MFGIKIEITDYDGNVRHIITTDYDDYKGVWKTHVCDNKGRCMGSFPATPIHNDSVINQSAEILKTVASFTM